MRFAKWWQGMERRLTRTAPHYQLGHRNLYILPSGYGSLWLLLAGVLYVLGIQSRSNGALLLAFLMAGLMLLSLFLTHLNLQGLQLLAIQQVPGFAGEPLTYRFQTISHQWRPSIKVRWQAATDAVQPVLHIQPGRQQIELTMPPHPRGRHLPGRLCIHTTAPLGLFRCWTYWAPPQPLWVAPARKAGPVHELSNALVDARTIRSPHPSNTATGSEEFSELKAWRPEEGLHRIDWKAQARGRGLLVKEFNDWRSGELWLAPTPHLPWEIALEHLCARFCDEQQAGHAVGLSLPDGTRIEADTGRLHLEQCLRALSEAHRP